MSLKLSSRTCLTNRHLNGCVAICNFRGLWGSSFDSRCSLFSNEIELSYRSEKDTRIFVEKARAELPLIPLDEAESPGRLAYWSW